MTVYNIKHKYTGDVLYSTEAHFLGEAVEAAVKELVSLEEADIARAYLVRANLAGANFTRADLTSVRLTRAYLCKANLAGANLTRADLEGASLIGSNLVGANLAGANLIGTCLIGSSLDGASYGEGVPLTRPPLSVLGLQYPVLILDEHLKVGCQLHHIDEWLKFDDRHITQMDGSDALRFWRANKESLLALATAHRLSDARS